MSEIAVRTVNLTKIYRTDFTRKPRYAVRDLNLEIRAGEIFGLLGPNGSGKSTTLKMILNLAFPTRGTVEIFGKASGAAASRAGVGFLPENAYFYKFLTGEETLRFHGKLCGLRGVELRDRVRELIGLVGLNDARSARLSTYSNGMLQRIGLAQSLVHRPRLVVLDEPTASVDPAGSRDICNLIGRLKADGTTVLLSSHLLTQVEEICDRIAILNRGELVREGTVAEITESSRRTELLIANAPDALLAQLQAQIENSTATLVASRPARTSLEEVFLAATNHPVDEQK